MSDQEGRRPNEIVLTHSRLVKKNLVILSGAYDTASTLFDRSAVAWKSIRQAMSVGRVDESYQAIR
jgi:hypothetical protein